MRANYKAKENWKPLIPVKDDIFLRCCYKYLVNKLKKLEKSKEYDKLGYILSDKLRNRNVYFASSYSPASTLIDFKKSFKCCERLILIDTEFIKKFFSKDEICAIILHELGHICYELKKSNNQCKECSETEEEFFADDCARIYGFEEELLSSLEKQKEFRKKNGFENTELLDERINRINNNGEIKVDTEVFLKL